MRSSTGSLLYIFLSTNLSLLQATLSLVLLLSCHLSLHAISPDRFSHAGYRSILVVPSLPKARSGQPERRVPPAPIRTPEWSSCLYTFFCLLTEEGGNLGRSKMLNKEERIGLFDKDGQIVEWASSFRRSVYIFKKEV